MEKKIYVPTRETLGIMKKMGADVYRYLVIKAAESLIIEGVKNPEKGILKNTYRCIQEHPDIAHAVCRVFPEEIQYSQCAKYDSRLCNVLIKSNDTTLQELDNLAYFAPAIQTNDIVTNNAIEKLGRELKFNPKYRFTYKESELLDKIFSLDISSCQINNKENLMNYAAIEPAYAIKLLDDLTEIEAKEILLYGIEQYSERYDLSEEIGEDYYTKDIVFEPDKNVKRLIRCIKKNPNNIY